MSSLRNQVTEISKPQNRKSWFFGIGINDYSDEKWPKLHNAARDVQKVMDLLTQEYDVEIDTSVLLLDAEATEDRIIDHFEYLADNIDPEDKLLIYYSGHGHYKNNTKIGWWIPVDGKHGKSGSYIPNSTIRDYIDGIKAKHILLISDSCFSGSLLGGSTKSAGIYDQLEQRASRWALCSGRHDEEVFDGVPGGHSPFAVSILDALKYNNDALYNVGKLAETVRDQTSSKYTQTPIGRPLKIDSDRGGQYIFRRKGTTAEWSQTKRKEYEVKETTQKPVNQTGDRKGKQPVSKTVSPTGNPSKTAMKIKLILGTILIIIVILAVLYFVFWR